MRHQAKQAKQAKQAIQCSSQWHGLVARIGMRVTSNQSAKVTRPQIMLAQFGRRVHAEMPAVQLSLLEGLVVRAHGLLL